MHFARMLQEAPYLVENKELRISEPFNDEESAIDRAAELAMEYPGQRFEVLHEWQHALTVWYNEEEGLYHYDGFTEEIMAKVDKAAIGTAELREALAPISFSRLKKIKDPSELLKDYSEDEIIAQFKYDGWKMMASHDADGVKLFSRRGKEITPNFPYLEEALEDALPIGNAVLGEIVAFDESGIQSISAVQSIAGSNPERGIEKTKELEEAGGHVVYMVYDLLEHDGKEIMDEPLSARDALLRKTLDTSSPLIEIPENFPFKDWESVLEKSLAIGGEGLVFKPLDSPYIHGEPGEKEKMGKQVKYKPGPKAHIDEVFIESYTLGEPDPKGYQKAVFPAYQYKDGEPVEVGKLSGLPRALEAEVKERIDNGEKIVVEVTYQERMPSGKFRHMGWSRLRPDKPLESVTVEEENGYKTGERREAAYETTPAIPGQAHKEFDAAINKLNDFDGQALQFISNHIKSNGDDTDRYGANYINDVNDLVITIKDAVKKYKEVQWGRGLEARNNAEVLKNLSWVAEMLGYANDSELQQLQNRIDYVKENLTDLMQRFFGIDWSYDHPDQIPEYQKDLDDYFAPGWTPAAAINELGQLEVVIATIKKYKEFADAQYAYAKKWYAESFQTTPEKIFPEGVEDREIMWHVTTAYHTVLKEGLKAKNMLENPAGLGGGSSDLISFTASLEHAYGIRDAMVDMALMMRGPHTIEAVDEFRKEIELSDEGFNWVLEQFRKNWGEDVEKYFGYLIEYVFVRAQQEGVRYSPVFFGGDIRERFSKIDPEEIGIIEAVVDTTLPEVTYHRAEEEWRIPPEGVLSLGPINSQSLSTEKSASVGYRLAFRLRDGGPAEKALEQLLIDLLPGTVFEGKVFAVGGYVRDELVGKEPNDLDAVVEMQYGAQRFAEFLHETFEDETIEPRPVTLDYPIWYIAFEQDVVWNGRKYQVGGAELDLADTQTLIDLNGESSTIFGPISEDVQRRDFTVNMLFKDLSSGEIIDPTGLGRTDLEHGLLRPHPGSEIGKGFREQPRRMLRLIRFMTKYNWKPSPDTERVLRESVDALKGVSEWGLKKEFYKLKKHGLLDAALVKMQEYGMLEPLREAWRKAKEEDD